MTDVEKEHLRLFGADDFIEKYWNSVPWNAIPWKKSSDVKPDLSKYEYSKFSKGRSKRFIVTDDTGLVLEATYCEYESGTQQWWDRHGSAFLPKLWVEIEEVLKYW